MKISKYLKVDKKARFSILRKLQIKQKNRCKGHLYLVCTSDSNHLLFEIIESKYLCDRYEECYLVAVAASREKAFSYVRTFINELYNLKVISYDMLKT